MYNTECNAKSRNDINEPEQTMSNSQEEVYITGEIAELRSKYSKTYEQSDGGRISVVSAAPICFYGEEKDRERRAEIKDKIGMAFSEDVNFFNYSCRPYWNKSYDESTGKYIKQEYPEHGIFEIKIRIQESELKKIIKDIGFYEQPISSIPPGVKAGYNCDWWDLKISDIKDSYCQLYVKRLSDDYIIRSANREIVVTNEYAGKGYLTVYLVLQ